MEEIIYGAVGVLGALGLLGLGAVIGRKAEQWAQGQRRFSAAREEGAHEAQQQREDAAAFSLLMGYNADLAYGVTAPQDLLDNNAGASIARP